jgi:hypothetical protein
MTRGVVGQIEVIGIPQNGMSLVDVAKAIPKVAKEAQDLESALSSIAMDDARLLVPALHNGRCKCSCRS